MGDFKVLILTEGGPNIGFGHLTRCNSIAEALVRRGASVLMVIHSDKLTVEHFCSHPFVILNWVDEPDLIWPLITDQNLVIIDSYLASRSFYQRVSERVPMAAYLDDDNRMAYPKGVVINGSLAPEQLGYLNSSNLNYLVGWKYILLRHEFWPPSSFTINNEIRNVMLTLGGDDFRDLTPRLLQAINRRYPTIHKRVVITHLFKNFNGIQSLGDAFTEWVVEPDAGRMRLLMENCDLAISAGGQTLYELARIGLPTLVVRIADNQLSNIEGFVQKGAVGFVGAWDDPGLLHGLEQKLSLFENVEMRTQASRISQSCVDGEGVFRVVDFLMNEAS